MGVSFLAAVAGLLVLFSSSTLVVSAHRVVYPVCKPWNNTGSCRGEQDGSIFCETKLILSSNKKLAVRSMPALSTDSYESHTQLDDFAFFFGFNLSEGIFSSSLRVCTTKGSSFAGPHGLKPDDLPKRKNTYRCSGVGNKMDCWMKFYPWSPSLLLPTTKYDPDWNGCLRTEGEIYCYLNIRASKKELPPSEDQLVSDYNVAEFDEHSKKLLLPSGPAPLKQLVVTLQRPPGLSGTSYN